MILKFNNSYAYDIYFIKIFIINQICKTDVDQQNNKDNKNKKNQNFLKLNIKLIKVFSISLLSFEKFQYNFDR